MIEPRAIRTVPDRIAWAITPPIVRGVGRLAWRLRIDLDRGLPDPPFVVAANHHSFLDPFLIGAALGQKVRFLAISGLFGNYRWVDYALTTFDVIPVKKGVVQLGPIREAMSHLETGGSIGIFPEGTRHREFSASRIRRGAGWLAARAQVPLVPIAVSGSETVLGPDNRLHTGRIRLTVGPALPPSSPDRKAIEGQMQRWAAWVRFTLDHEGY